MAESVKRHPTDHTMMMFWDVAMGEPNAFYLRSGYGWTWNGDPEKPTVNPSILLTKPDGYRNHLFIRDGKIQYLPDCTHELAGKNVDMVPFPEDW